MATTMAADMDVKQRFFPHTQDELKEIASDILRHAKSLGGTDAATEISEGDGLSVSVRRGEVETIEHNRDKMVGVTVFIGNKRGNASTSDFTRAALKDTVAAAYNIARFTAEEAPQDSPKKICSKKPRRISISTTHGTSTLKKPPISPVEPRTPRSQSINASRTPKAQASRRSTRSSCWLHRAGSWAVIRSRAITWRVRLSRGPAATCNATTGIHRKATPPISPNRKPSAGTPRIARSPAWAHADWTPANAA